MKLVTLKINASERIAAMKLVVPPVLWRAAYRALVIKRIPDHRSYDPHYAPWLEPARAARTSAVTGNTGITPQGLYTLLHFLKESLSLVGDVVECGVWRGGSAKLLRDTLIEEKSDKQLHLFDSFEGMARVDTAEDRHDVGDFRDTSLDHVRQFVTGSLASDADNVVQFHKGWIPDTFAGLEDMKICFAHIDLDLYQSILDALTFIYPRLSSRGVIVFDDYGFASCPGARKAVDEFFSDKSETPFVLSTAQAFVIKR